MSQLILQSFAPLGLSGERTVLAGPAGKELQRRQRGFQLKYPARERLAQELFNLVDPQVTASWHGAGASPARAEAVAAGLRFLLLLPRAFLADVEISPDRDGAVSFDWFVNAQKQLSISFGPAGELHYAAILGPVERASGRLLFDDSLPEEIARLLGRITRT